MFVNTKYFVIYRFVTYRNSTSCAEFDIINFVFLMLCGVCLT